MGGGELGEGESIDDKRGLRFKEATMYVQGLGEQREAREDVCLFAYT